MMGTFRRYGPAFAGVLILILGGAPPGNAYKGAGWNVNSGGGPASGGGYGSIAAVGVHTSGVASSAAYVHQEGMLAFYGRPYLFAAPTALAFGSVTLGASELLTATVTNYGGVSLLLSDFAVAGGAFAIESPSGASVIPPGASLDVGVRFSPAQEGAVHDTLRATTNDPGVPAWSLPLSGNGQSSAVQEIFVAVDSIDFGAAPVDSMVNAVLTVENIGGAALTVGPITTSDAVFGASPDSFTLAAGGHQDVTLRFTPDRAAVWVETLHLPSDDPNRATPVEVILAGRVPAILTVVEPAARSIHFRAAEDGPAPVASLIRIRNDGAETLHWRATKSGVAGWLGVAPDSGSVAPGNLGTLAVAAVHAGLLLGDYHASVALRNEDRPVADADTVDVSLTVAPFTVATTATPLLPDEGENVWLNVTATVSVDSARLYFRQGGARNWNHIAMSTHDDTACAAMIPGQLVGLRGLESWVRVYADGRSVDDPDLGLDPPRRVVVKVANAVSPMLAGGQHALIGAPLLTTGAIPADVFVDDLGEHDRSMWRLGRWDPAQSAYREFPDDLGAGVEAGTGFWLITKSNETYALPGLSTFPPLGDSVFVITLPGGAGSWWSQIADPFAYAVDWSRCMVRDGAGGTYPMNGQPGDGLVESAAYTYVYDGPDGRYEEAALLEPWQGYFVNNISGGEVSLLVPAREESPGKARIAERSAPRAEEGEWEIRLRARGATGASGDVIAGVRVEAREGWDRFDRHRPPPAPAAGPALALRPRDAMPDRGDLRADIRPPRPEPAVWDLTVSFEGEKDVVIESEGAGALPPGSAAFLVDDGAGVTVALRPGAAYRATAGRGEERRALRLVVGGAATLAASGYEQEEVTTTLRLGLPYPNPALHGTTVRYALPGAGRVKLQVFTLAGRHVRDLEDGVRAPGEHAAVWDGRDESGRDVGPGLYFIRLAYENRVQTARVVVFR